MSGMAGIRNGFSSASVCRQSPALRAQLFALRGAGVPSRQLARGPQPQRADGVQGDPRDVPRLDCAEAFRGKERRITFCQAPTKHPSLLTNKIVSTGFVKNDTETKSTY